MSYQFANNQVQSSFGLAPNVAALVSYIWIPVTSIIVLVTEKQNRAVRFHAFQSLFLGLGVFAVSIALSIVMGVVSAILAAVSSTLGVLAALVSLVAWLAFTVAILAAWILCLVKAYRGEMYQLPVVGKFAAGMVNQ